MSNTSDQELTNKLLDIFSSSGVQLPGGTNVIEQIADLINSKQREAYQSVLDEYEKDLDSSYFSSSGGHVDLASFAEDRIAQLKQEEQSNE